ncbi:MAG: hypothetical protein IKX00_03700 [Bacilli bacterium]|nr:hypothetical protein [Bacilli bacterium]
MNDEKLDIAKEYLDTFPTFEDFKRDYLDVNKPANEKFLTYLFTEIKDKPDVWEETKYRISIETLRIDIKLKDKENLTIDDIVNEVKKNDLSKYKRILVKLDNKNYDDIDKLSKLGIDVLISTKGEKGFSTIDEFKFMREFFNIFKEQCNYPNLSVLEKITLAYDHVKFFLYNPENNRNIMDSRGIARSMKTGNIVCEAYSRIFCQLLSEFGINSHLTFIKGKGKDESSHARVIVKVEDPKYNVKGVFAFDPTWDSDLEMALVSHEDGNVTYESKKYLKETDTVIEDLPSSIRYLYFLVPLYEYDKYFTGDEIDRIQKYPTFNKVELTDGLTKILKYNDLKPREKTVLDILPDLLSKTKKIEGYSDDEIKEFINHAVNILNQYRFGRLDKNLKTQVSSQR